MTLTLNGSNNTIAGLAVGGLPDGIVDTDMLAAGAATKAKRTFSTGEIIQTKSLVYTAIDQTYSSQGFHATPVTAQITPVATSSKILVMATLTVGCEGLGEGASFKVMKSVGGGTYADTAALGDDAGGGATRGAVGGVYDNNLATHTDCRSIQFLDSPSTTSPIDYKIYLYLYSASKPAKLNRPHTATSGEHITGSSSIVLMEVAG